MRNLFKKVVFGGIGLVGTVLVAELAIVGGLALLLAARSGESVGELAFGAATLVGWIVLANGVRRFGDSRFDEILAAEIDAEWEAESARLEDGLVLLRRERAERLDREADQDALMAELFGELETVTERDDYHPAGTLD